MGIFNDIDEAHYKLVGDLFQDADLLKLIRYDDFDPLSQPIVQNPQEMIYIGQDEENEQVHRIYLLPKLPEIEDSKKTFIIPATTRIQPSSGTYRMDFNMTFNIATELSLWNIKDGKRRIYQIMDKIDQWYNRKVTEYSMNVSVPRGVSEWTPSTKWRGKILSYRFTLNSVECDNSAGN